MNTSLLKTTLSCGFGLLVFCIGFVNTFWGNDPFYGLVIILLSVLFLWPVIKWVLTWMPKKTLLIAKIILGVLILWSSLGVGELFEKIELMQTYFPLPKNDNLHPN